MSKIAMYEPSKPERSKFETFDYVTSLFSFNEMTKDEIIKIEFDLLRRCRDEYGDGDTVKFVKRGKFDQSGYDTAMRIYEEKMRQYNEWKIVEDRQQYEILKKKFGE